MHSIFSDGTDTPEALIEYGVDAGLRAMALTDHDTISGVGRFVAAARGKSVRAIPGVEVSADFGPGTMHILGYFVDVENRMLLEHLEWIRTGREKRNEEIFRKLHKIGLKLTWDDVRKHAGDEQIGRPHFARALVARGYVPSVREAFSSYLAKKRPAYAERRRLAPESCIELIATAGGVPVLAHPYTLDLPIRELRELLEWLVGAGLQGLEVYYPEHNRATRKRYKKLADEFNLVATGGSDFHGDLFPEVELGVGTGDLNVPDEVVKELETRCAV